MRSIFLALTGVMLVLLAVLGGAENALALAMVMAVAELGCLCAPEMYFISAAMETDDKQRARLGNTAAWLVLGSAAAVAVLVFFSDMAREWGAVGTVYAMLRVQLERARLLCRKGTPIATGIGVAALMLVPLVLPLMYARGFALAGLVWVAAAELLIRLTYRPGSDFAWPGVRPTMALFRALPEAMLSRALYLIPAAALLIGGWHGWHVSTVLAYAAGLAVFSALRIDTELRGAAQERFGVRWLFGGLMTAICVLLGWNGVFSAAYCVWGVIAALLPVQRSGRAWLCALLVLLQAVCGYFGGCGMLNGWIAAAAAFALAAAMALVQKDAIYAAYLPVRAWFIRRKARG